LSLRKPEALVVEKLDGVCKGVGSSFWTELNAFCGEVGWMAFMGRLLRSRTISKVDLDPCANLEGSPNQSNAHTCPKSNLATTPRFGENIIIFVLFRVSVVICEVFRIFGAL
jgi:hypothetical protein